MNRKLFRGIVLALIALAIAFPTGMLLREKHAGSQARVVAWNDGSRAQTIRVTDTLTGLAVVTARVEAGRRSVVFEGRLEPWWVGEDPDGGRRKLVIETLSSGCDLLGRTTALERVEELFIDPDGSLAHTFWQAGDPALGDRSIATPVEDPCAGRPAIPRGLVINRTMVAVQVHAGFVLEPCSERTIRPGDLVPWDGPVPAPPEGVVAVPIQEIEVQDERWPRRPTTLLISADFTGLDAGLEDPADFGPCIGRPALEGAG